MKTMTTQKLTDEQVDRMLSAHINGGPQVRDVVRAIVAALPVAAPVTGEEAGDPLQGAANWLVEGVVDCTSTDIQKRLLVGYNRAKRLFAVAVAARPAEKFVPWPNSYAPDNTSQLG